jgi:hypothetical protein
MHTTHPPARLCLIIALIFAFAALALAQSQAAYPQPIFTSAACTCRALEISIVT